MTSSVRLTPEAEADIRDAYDWYEAIQAGLGDRFLAAVTDGLDYMAEWPEASPVVHEEIRRTLLQTFPYGLFYVLEEEVVIVLGCFHARRDPSAWSERTRRRPKS